MPTIFRGDHDGRDRRFGIVVSLFSKALKEGKPIGEVLLEGCVTRLLEAGVDDENIHIAYVPGAFEIPLAAKAMAEHGFEIEVDDDGGTISQSQLDQIKEIGAHFTNGNGHNIGDDESDENEITIEGEIVEHEHLDAIITLGCIIRGETPHFEYVAGAAARGVANVSLTTGVPVIFGVLTCDTADQALARSGGAAGHAGIECAEAALETASLHWKIQDWDSEY
ncbi:MAG: 6,7-dimethyl-8-ribityllumazine synthase [Planctomycetes bacterium]|nr:6,7-dimethyl-8-ribityllumazine synthase [Planctomycetota bacterium]